VLLTTFPVFANIQRLPDGRAPPDGPSQPASSPFRHVKATGHTWRRSSIPASSPSRARRTFLDPCFGADNADGLACPSAPWSTEYVKIAGIGQSGDTSGPKTGGLPWGLELSDGNRCAAASGGTNSIGGKRLNYFCSGGGAVYGDPIRGDTWQVSYTQKELSGPFVQVPVKRVWF